MGLRKIIGFSDLIGGTKGCLDEVDTSTWIIADGASAIGVNSHSGWYYELIDDGNAVEDGITYIKPDIYSGNQIWKLVKSDRGTISEPAGTTYTLQATDHNAVISLDNINAITCTLPDGLHKGFQCSVIQNGTGQITFSAETTLNSNGNKYTSIGQYAVITCIHMGSNVWVISGGLTT